MKIASICQRRVVTIDNASSLVQAAGLMREHDVGALVVTTESSEGPRVTGVVTDRDLISIPPGVYRGEINIGDEDALMCVMLGSPKPVTPTYPADHPLAKLKRG